MKPHEWFVEHRLDYATRTLDAEEATAFESHLAGCEECLLEVTRMEEDLRWLPMGVSPAAPSPGFRDRITAGALGRRRARRPRWELPLSLAASVLLLAGGWYLGGSRARELQTTVAALQDTLSIMRQANRVLQANLEVGDIRGGLLIFADEVTHRWNVVVHGLPPAPAGHRYQFWFICSDGMVRGTEITVDTTRPTMFTTGMPQAQSCPVVKGAALTEERMADVQGPPRGKSLAHLML